MSRRGGNRRESRLANAADLGARDAEIPARALPYARGAGHPARDPSGRGCRGGWLPAGTDRPFHRQPARAPRYPRRHTIIPSEVNKEPPAASVGVAHSNPVKETQFMIKRYETTNFLSKVLVANGFAFLSGLTAKDRSGGVIEQTADILAQIDDYLAMAGTDKSRIVVANIW